MVSQNGWFSRRKPAVFAFIVSLGTSDTTICRIWISSMASHNENRNDIQCVMYGLAVSVAKKCPKKRQTDLQNQKDGV